MPSSYKTHTFTYKGGATIKSGKKEIPIRPNDLHIRFEEPVKVEGVDGIKPSDPNAPYTLEGDESTNITIKDMPPVNAGGAVKVRIKGGEKLPDITRANWTWEDTNIPEKFMQYAMAEPAKDDEEVALNLDDTESGGELAYDLLPALLKLSDTLKQIISRVKSIS